MRWAILSDVHGNLQALEAVVAHLKTMQDLDGIVFLGDVLGYGADPNDSLELLREICALWVAGNHEHGVLGRTDIGTFNEEARAAILWCRDHLIPAHRAFLDRLPLMLDVEEFLCVHATPHHPGEWLYLFTWDDAREAFRAMPKDLCFVGHSHIPLVLCQKPSDEIQVMQVDALQFLPGHRYLINPGSVGQPRDGNPHASFGIYDSQAQTYSLRRVPYDVQVAADRIMKMGLPPSLAHRLYLGI